MDGPIGKIIRTKEKATTSMLAHLSDAIVFKNSQAHKSHMGHSDVGGYFPRVPWLQDIYASGAIPCTVVGSRSLKEIGPLNKGELSASLNGFTPSSDIAPGKILQYLSQSHSHI